MRDTLPAVRNLTASERSHFTRTLAARARVPLGLLLLTVIYFWPQVVEGKALYWGDIGLYFTPMSDFLRQNLRTGHLPLWNPLIFCGTPYSGNPQTWPLYPLTALLPFLSAPYFLSLTVALHVWLAGTGTYLFARRALGIGRSAALLSALTFMFGGQLVSKEQFPNMVQAAAWLPWVLWGLDRVVRERRIRDALRLGLVLGLQLLAAHVQMTVLTLYLAAAWGVFAVAAPPAPNNRGARPFHEKAPSFFRLPYHWKRGWLLLMSFLIAAGLAAGQLLPTLALFRDAARQKLPFSIVNRFYLPPNQLGNFALPHLHGNPFYGDWTARGNIWETCCYVGWLSFGLALWGGIAAWRQGEMQKAQFWTVVFVFGVWMAMGGRGGLYHLAYFALPAFRAFHDPARCLLWACFALSLLAGYGWEKLPPFPVWANRRLVTAGVFFFAFIDLAYFGRTLYPLTNPSALFPAAPNIAAVQTDPDVRAHQARILAPTPGVWLRFSNYKDFRQSTPGYQTLWAETLTPNLMMPYDLRDAYGYEPVALKDAQTVDGRAAHAFDPKANAVDQAQAANLTGALGVKYIAVCRVVPPEASLPGLILLRTSPTLAPPGKMQTAAARIYLSRNTQWQPRVHLEGARTPLPLTDDGPDQVTVSCVTTSPARLILADTQAAGWQVKIDGRPSRIETYGGSLRSVSLAKPGTHVVIFAYQPTPFRLGLYLSLLTLSGLAGALGFAVTRNLTRREGFGIPDAE